MVLCLAFQAYYRSVYEDAGSCPITCVFNADLFLKNELGRPSHAWNTLTPQ